MTRVRTLLLVAGLAVIVTANTTHASPRNDYLLNCMGCHLQDGGGTEGKVPALKGQVSKFLHIEGGRAFLVQVPGSSQSRLTDSETAGVLNYILTTFDAAHLPEDFKPYTEAEIARLRPHIIKDVTSVRRALIEGTDIE